MRRAVLLLVLTCACGHTRTSALSETEGAPSATTPPPTFTSENGIPLSTSSGGLLKPGAAKMIQQRLENAGVLPEEEETGAMDAVTRAAISRFQDAHGLPATGEPDLDTVEKLGLKAKDVFVSGQSQSGRE
jgi:peptidoglycan hydrolase-like protein with peptidoglycan-binding domain